VTGGSDINPALYGHDDAPWSPPDVIRDEFELAVLQLAELHELPVLGICRGAQLINVFLGGSLHTDITRLRKAAPNRSSILPVKWADIVPGSRLAGIIGSESLCVNSLHHQAVRTVGAGLQVVARDRDGLPQAVERDGDRFLIGVQWHPEYLAYRKRDRKLFRELVRAARRP
jgi:putative glutamine amidotransferase